MLPFRSEASPPYRKNEERLPGASLLLFSFSCLDTLLPFLPDAMEIDILFVPLLRRDGMTGMTVRNHLRKGPRP